MQFSEFAQVLKPIISGGVPIPAFVRSLFLSVAKTQKNINAINNISDTTAQYYYSGDHKIHKIAVQIRKEYEPELFVDFFKDVGEQAIQDICDDLRKYAPEINPFNAAETCKDIFAEIINTASQTQKRSKRTKKDTKKDTKVIENDSGKISTLFFSLLEECSMRCPKCGRRLVSNTKDGNKCGNYSVIDLSPWFIEVPQDEVQSKIMLCEDCAADYDMLTPPHEYEKLLDLKNNLRISNQQKYAADALHLEDGVDQILRNLSGLKKRPDPSSMKYEALAVEKKIVEENFMLLDEITDYVLKYFKYIKEQIGELEDQGILNFRQLKHDFNDCYGLMADGKRTQQEIFDSIAIWVMDRTNVNNIRAAKAVVAFFVQICEVFDEIAE